MKPPHRQSNSATPRLPLVEETAADAEQAELFASMRSRSGRLLNLHRMVGYAPALMCASLEMALALRHGTSLPRRLVELVILRTAHLMRSAYEWQQHEPMAREAGCSADEIAAIENWQGSALFSDSEQAALAFCDCIVKGEEPSASDFGRLQQHFSGRAIVELATLVSQYVATAHVVRVLGVPLETTKSAAQG
jgi:alkylhydroperoxidase family enzyme